MTEDVNSLFRRFMDSGMSQSGGCHRDLTCIRLSYSLLLSNSFPEKYVRRYRSRWNLVKDLSGLNGNLQLMGQDLRPSLRRECRSNRGVFSVVRSWNARFDGLIK